MSKCTGILLRFHTKPNSDISKHVFRESHLIYDLHIYCHSLNVTKGGSRVGERRPRSRRRRRRWVGFGYPLPRKFFEFLSRNMAHFCAFCSSNFGGKRMPDVEGQWDFYPNLRLKIIFFIMLNCAVRFVKFATLSRSSGTQISNADFHHLYNHFIYTCRPLEHPRNIPARKKIFHTLTTGSMAPRPPGSALERYTPFFKFIMLNITTILV